MKRYPSQRYATAFPVSFRLHFHIHKKENSKLPSPILIGFKALTIYPPLQDAKTLKLNPTQIFELHISERQSIFNARTNAYWRKLHIELHCFEANKEIINLKVESPVRRKLGQKSSCQNQYRKALYLLVWNNSNRETFLCSTFNVHKFYEWSIRLLRRVSCHI